MSEISYREATADMVAEIAEFLNIGAADFFNYEYMTYMPDKAVFSVLIENDRIVGSQALMPYNLNISGTKYLCGRSERTKLADSLRGRGMFPKLMSYCVNRARPIEMKLIFGFTTAKKAFERAGFRHFSGFYEHAILVLNHEKAVRDISNEKNMKLKYVKIAACFGSRVCRIINILRGAGKIGTGGYDITDTLADAGDLGDLFARIRGTGELVSIEQDGAYLEWAYEKGIRRHKKWYIYQGGELLAYMVFDITDRRTVQMVDFASSEPGAFQTGMEQALRDLDKLGAAFVLTAYNKKNLHLAKLSRQLRRNGFMPFYTGGNMVLRIMDSERRELTEDLRDWYVTPSWVMLSRKSAADISTYNDFRSVISG